MNILTERPSDMPFITYCAIRQISNKLIHNYLSKGRFVVISCWYTYDDKGHVVERKTTKPFIRDLPAIKEDITKEKYHQIIVNERKVRKLAVNNTFI